MDTRMGEGVIHTHKQNLRGWMCLGWVTGVCSIASEQGCHQLCSTKSSILMVTVGFQYPSRSTPDLWWVKSILRLTLNPKFMVVDKKLLFSLFGGVNFKSFESRRLNPLRIMVMSKHFLTLHFLFFLLKLFSSNALNSNVIYFRNIRKIIVLSSAIF